MQASQPTWKAYAKQVIANARILADELVAHGYKLQTNGTDNHLVLWDLRPLKLTGSKLEKLCDFLGITINSKTTIAWVFDEALTFVFAENAVSGDASAQTPGGIRLGTSALTSRDMCESDMKTVAGFLHRAVQLALLIQKESGSKLLKDFVIAASTEKEGKEGAKLVKQLRKEVKEFATKWPLPGVDVKDLKKPAGIEEED